MDVNTAEVTRILAAYREMPGLSLTCEQVERLCGVEPRISRLLLQRLVDAGALRQTPRGYYVSGTHV